MVVLKKWVLIGMGWALAAFVIATIVLAVQKGKLRAELREAQEKLDLFESQLTEHWPMDEDNLRELPETFEDGKINYRLPDTLLVHHYDLTLVPNIETGIFNGSVDIHVSVVKTTRQIFVHSHQLDIRSVNVRIDDSRFQALQIESFELDLVREFLIINLAEDLSGSMSGVIISIVFGGQMLNKIVGLYSSSYLTPDQQKRTIATSKFEPTYARQAFPCFDEPAMKATFSVNLMHPAGNGYHALSNMNEEKSEPFNDLTNVQFAKSVPMSTYLACFIVSDFVHKTRPVNANGIGDNFDIRIYATAHQLDKVDFAVDTAVSVTEFYIRYFQVEYPLPKLDMAAIPDFASNAMEHWGLVTYRETALLYDKSFSSTWNKQRVAAVIAHELAHMWFGNLVTMMWWNDLWLNEGFARYMEYKAINEVYSSWGLPDQFLVHALHGVMKFDSSVASHPIRQTVENPDQITEIFDTISYEKGASVIRMLEDVVGPEQFGIAVTNYLKEYKYDNAVTDNFIAELEKLGLDFNVKLMMSTWTEQMGFPVIEVKKSAENIFEITQKRFFSNIEDYNGTYDDSEFKYTWEIPLTYITDSSDIIHRVWFNHNSKSVVIAVQPGTKWIKFNAHQVGYYRVNYEEDIWQAIVTDLIAAPQKFTIADRAHLLNDVFALADASQLDYHLALDFTQYLNKEQAFVPWHVATSKLQALHVSLMHTESYKSYLRYTRSLIELIYKEVGWSVDEDNHLRNRLRVSVLTAACTFGLPDCLNQAATIFSAWLANPDLQPHPDLREIVYYFGVEQVGNEINTEEMWKRFLQEEDANEKLKLMYGLSAIREPWLLHKFIELASNENYIRRQDYFTCIQNIANNPVGESLVWDYVRNDWEKLVLRFGLNDRYLGRMISSITDRFATQTRLEEMQQFFEKYPQAGAGTAARNQALETVKFNIKWLQENSAKIEEWLKTNA